jgi:hypothetical protein
MNVELKDVIASKVEELKTLWQPLWITTSPEGDILMIAPLMFHVALYINPEPNGNFEDRYCISNTELAIIAAHEFMQTGVMRYWQKHWNKNISIAGHYAYRSGDLQLPENALYEVDWDADELRQQYPH